MKYIGIITIAQIRDLRIALENLDYLCRQMPEDHPLLGHACQHVTEAREHITKAKYALGEYLFPDDEEASK